MGLGAQDEVDKEKEEEEKRRREEEAAAQEAARQAEQDAIVENFRKALLEFFENSESGTIIHFENNNSTIDDSESNLEWMYSAGLVLALAPEGSTTLVGLGLLATYAHYTHVNNKNNKKPNIVYEIWEFTLFGPITRKYGVSSKADFVRRSGNPRPEYQVLFYNTAYAGRFFGYTILARTPDRETALEIEKILVRQYRLNNSGDRPAFQKRPLIILYHETSVFRNGI